ncbi:MAG TPA: OmpH family outer membrane protein [Bryobacteraceae bacterium]|nr:OmpH family outer membrane protein [Bryobacteraceae bacterium]
MKSKVFVWPLLALAATLGAQAQTQKIAVINVQAAIAGTKDGQKAAAELEGKAAPKKKELDGKQNEINALKDQLQKGQNTLSEATKNDLYKTIQQKTTSLQRDYEDAQADMDQEQQKILQQLGQKILATIERYARDHGFTLVVDVSLQPNPIMYASPSIEITKEIIDLYDQNSPAMTNPTAPKSSTPGLTNPAPAKQTPPAAKPGTPTKPPGGAH